MQEGVAKGDLLLLVPDTGGTQRPVPAAFGDSAEFLHIDVHELPGVGAFVADRGWFTDGKAGVHVQMPQKRHAVPVQDFRQGRLWQTQVIPDAVRAPAAAETQRDDPPFRVAGRVRMGERFGRDDLSFRPARP